MPLLWTDELSDRIAQDLPSCEPASVIAWICLTLGPLLAAAIVGVLVNLN